VLSNLDLDVVGVDVTGGHGRGYALTSNFSIDRQPGER
jgi:hypothetical protein